MITKDRKQDILAAAMELFARKGFRGTTTRDLAAHAGINEAIIFRHFSTKEALYSAILEFKACESQATLWQELEKLESSNDDVLFFETLTHAFLERHEKDTTFMRLLLFSALEGHELAEMFSSSMAGRAPLCARYIERRMNEGAFKRMDPRLVARAFIGMLVSFVIQQEILGMKRSLPYERAEVVRTFVSIFLSGMKEKI